MSASGRFKVLVTGCHGQLARSLVERAAAWPDIDIVPLGRPELDLEAPESIASAVRAVRPDMVVNAAAYTAVDAAEDEPERAQRVNAAAAGELAAAAHALGAGIVQISTDYVFDGRSALPYPEDAPAAPLNVYGRTKLEGERRVRDANPRHAIVRTAWLFSPWGRNFVRTMMSLAHTRSEVQVVRDQRGSPSYALDVADGLLMMLAAEAAQRGAVAGRVYHLAGGPPTSWSGLAAAVFDACEVTGHPRAAVIPISSAQRPSGVERPVNSALTGTGFEKDFGFRMPPWQPSVALAVRRIAGTAQTP